VRGSRVCGSCVRGSRAWGSGMRGSRVWGSCVRGSRAWRSCVRGSRVWGDCVRGGIGAGSRGKGLSVWAVYGAGSGQLGMGWGNGLWGGGG
jgi:hypothetical protein